METNHKYVSIDRISSTTFPFANLSSYRCCILQIDHENSNYKRLNNKIVMQSKTRQVLFPKVFKEITVNSYCTMRVARDFLQAGRGKGAVKYKTLYANTRNQVSKKGCWQYWGWQTIRPWLMAPREAGV